MIVGQKILSPHFYSKIWKYLGYKDISDMYGLFYEKNPIDKEIENGFVLVNDRKDVDSIINDLYLPTLEIWSRDVLDSFIKKKSGA